MDHCTSLVFFAFSLSALIADLHTCCDTGAVKIQRCRDGFTDVEEDVTNSITCTDFVDTDTVTWTITKDGVSTDVAMCTPSGCTNHSSDVGAVREAGNKTQLLYPSRDRDQDQGTSVSCTSNKSQTGQRTTSCTLNVISLATLSQCDVTLQEIDWTVTGSCHFDHAFSYLRGLSCTWYRSSSGKSSGQGGKITNRQDYTSSGRVYDRGECTFTSPAPTEGGQYTFSVDFYPSAGGHVVKTLTIPERNGDPESTQPPSTPSALTEPPATPPVITGYSAGSVLTEGGPLSLTCTVTGGRPLVTAVTLFCSSRPHVSGPSSVNRQRTAVSTTLDIAALRPSDNGSLCVCTATWEGAPQRYNMAATVSLTVMADSERRPSDTSDRDASSKTAPYIGGGIAAAVVVVAVVVGIVLLRKYLGRSQYDRPQPRREEPTYTDLAVYEDTTQQTQYENGVAGSLPHAGGPYENVASFPDKDHPYESAAYM